MNTPPPLGIAELNRARHTASRFRAEWLMLVNAEMVTTGDLLQEAARPESARLLKLSLRQVLLAQPGWGRARTESILRHIADVVGVTIDHRKFTVGWLLDPRAGGRRFAAWLDAFAPKNQLPWAGFPFAGGSNG